MILINVNVCKSFYFVLFNNFTYINLLIKINKINLFK